MLLCFHAHPDDEVFGTGGVMRLAADAGHRVVVVVATDGALGEVPDGLLAEGEELAARRRRELEESTTLLGADRLVMLGYADSGMAGTPENANPHAFANTDIEEVAQRLAEVLQEERADVVTIYDDNGGYGHPDHIQVHRVGVRATEIAGISHVYESTINRDHMRAMLASHPQWGTDEALAAMDALGLPDEEITTEVDVSGVLASKRAAMLAHATQVGDFGPFLQMSEDELAHAFGREWFRRRGSVPGGPRETALPL